MLWSVSSAWSQEQVIQGTEKLPPRESGVIDGKPAILFWPYDATSKRLLDPKGCNVTLEPHDTRQFVYYTHPCGEWFLPREGRYDAWVDGPDYVSSAVTVFGFGGGEFMGTGARSLRSVVPAGRMRLSPSTKVPARAETVRIVSLRDGAWVPFQRIVSIEAFRTGVGVPAGRAIVGVFSPEGDALSITRPIDVKAGAVHDVVPPASRKGTDVFLVVRKTPPEAAARAGASVTLRAGGKTLSPAATLDSSENFVAVWYDVQPEGATASAAIEVLPYAGSRIDVVLSPGAVRTVRVNAVPLPQRKPKEGK